MTFGKPPSRNSFNDLFPDQQDGNELFRWVNALGQPPPPHSQIGDLFRDLANMGQASAAAKALDVSGLIPPFSNNSPHSAKALADALDVSGLTPLDTSSVSSAGALARLLEESYRRRADWNRWLATKQDPPSNAEQQTIDRAETNVRAAIFADQWMVDQGVSLEQQGSYLNKTNVRLDADVDLRLVHPLVQIEYRRFVVSDCADSVLGYTTPGMTFGQAFDGMRSRATAALEKQFGASNVILGNKAIHVKGVPGSRAMVDVVPCVQLHVIDWVSEWDRYVTTKGVAILTGKGWIYNFPDQHRANGRAKRRDTALRFKKMVRIFKALRDDMKKRRVPGASVPSFLVECLVYRVENGHFLQESDDLYDRVRRIALRMQRQLADPNAEMVMREINGIKNLFFAGQAWTFQQARAFADAAVTHLGTA